MRRYEDFAFIYDELMEETPYDVWVEFIQDIIDEQIQEAQLVLDLGCGTGNITIPLAEAGYQMIGIDLSENMLMLAREKSISKDLDILYLHQDMTEFELYGTVDVVVAACDSLNYISDEESLLKVFSLVDNYLNLGGVFIFDMNTRYRFEEQYRDTTFSLVEEEYAYIWNNTFFEETGMNLYEITFFIRDDEADHYSRFDEFHEEFTYSYETIETLLNKAGLELVNAYDNYTKEKAHDTSERITFVVKKNRK
ncbi:MAG: class I SAM-dependent methyltransferase [Vallitaleaceae bacterium]|nr:class I SAM-dependent methyltransferase [Vallitaleaceae bacterium]